MGQKLEIIPPVQNCGQVLCIADISAGLEEDPLLQREFVERSQRHFLSKSSAAFANCPVTDCSGILPKVPQDEKETVMLDSELMRHCEVCHNIICRRYARACN